MSHRRNCPDDWEARSQARDDASFDIRHGSGRYDYRNPYDCDEGNRTYEQEYRYQADQIEEEQRMERARERRREEARQEEEYYLAAAEEQARQEAEEAAYYEALEAEQHAASLRALAAKEGAGG